MAEQAFFYDIGRHRDNGQITLYSDPIGNFAKIFKPKPVLHTTYKKGVFVNKTKHEIPPLILANAYSALQLRASRRPTKATAIFLKNYTWHNTLLNGRLGLYAEAASFNPSLTNARRVILKCVAPDDSGLLMFHASSNSIHSSAFAEADESEQIESLKDNTMAWYEGFDNRLLSQEFRNSSTIKLKPYIIIGTQYGCAEWVTTSMAAKIRANNHILQELFPSTEHTYENQKELNEAIALFRDTELDLSDDELREKVLQKSPLHDEIVSFVEEHLEFITEISLNNQLAMIVGRTQICDTETPNFDLVPPELKKVEAIPIDSAICTELPQSSALVLRNESDPSLRPQVKLKNRQDLKDKHTRHRANRLASKTSTIKTSSDNIIHNAVMGQIENGSSSSFVSKGRFEPGQIIELGDDESDEGLPVESRQLSDIHDHDNSAYSGDAMDLDEVDANASSMAHEESEHDISTTHFPDVMDPVEEAAIQDESSLLIVSAKKDDEAQAASGNKHTETSPVNDAGDVLATTELDSVRDRRASEKQERRHSINFIRARTNSRASVLGSIPTAVPIGPLSAIQDVAKVDDCVSLDIASFAETLQHDGSVLESDLKNLVVKQDDSMLKSDIEDFEVRQDDSMLKSHIKDSAPKQDDSMHKSVTDGSAHAISLTTDDQTENSTSIAYGAETSEKKRQKGKWVAPLPEDQDWNTIERTPVTDAPTKKKVMKRKTKSKTVSETQSVEQTANSTAVSDAPSLEATVCAPISNPVKQAVNVPQPAGNKSKESFKAVAISTTASVLPRKIVKPVEKTATLVSDGGNGSMQSIEKSKTAAITNSITNAKPYKETAVIKKQDAVEAAKLGKDDTSTLATHGFNVAEKSINPSEGALAANSYSQSSNEAAKLMDAAMGRKLDRSKKKSQGKNKKKHKNALPADARQISTQESSTQKPTEDLSGLDTGKERLTANEGHHFDLNGNPVAIENSLKPLNETETTTMKFGALTFSLPKYPFKLSVNGVRAKIVSIDYESDEDESGNVEKSKVEKSKVENSKVMNSKVENTKVESRTGALITDIQVEVLPSSATAVSMDDSGYLGYSMDSKTITLKRPGGSENDVVVPFPLKAGSEHHRVVSESGTMLPTVTPRGLSATDVSSSPVFDASVVQSNNKISVSIPNTTQQNIPPVRSARFARSDSSAWAQAVPFYPSRQQAPHVAENGFGGYSTAHQMPPQSYHRNVSGYSLGGSSTGNYMPPQPFHSASGFDASTGHYMPLQPYHYNIAGSGFHGYSQPMMGGPSAPIVPNHPYPYSIPYGVTPPSMGTPYRSGYEYHAAVPEHQFQAQYNDCRHKQADNDMHNRHGDRKFSDGRAQQFGGGVMTAANGSGVNTDQPGTLSVARASGTEVESMDALSIANGSGNGVIFAVTPSTKIGDDVEEGLSQVAAVSLDTAGTATIDDAPLNTADSKEEEIVRLCDVDFALAPRRGVNHKRSLSVGAAEKDLQTDYVIIAMDVFDHAPSVGSATTTGHYKVPRCLLPPGVYGMEVNQFFPNMSFSAQQESLAALPAFAAHGGEGLP